MTRQIALVLVAAGFVLGTLPMAEAKQYNQRPFQDSRGNALIMSTIAKAKAVRGQEIESDDDGGTPPCGVERNGVIVDRRADGQSVIVLTRDIVATGGADVNIGRDCNR